MSELWPSASVRAALEETIQRANQWLDERRFGAWLEATAPEFVYRIVSYSPELRKDMTWLQHDRAGLAALIELLPKHHASGADWLRQVVVGSIDLTSDTEAAVTSTLSIFHTVVDVGDSHIDGGSTQLFAVGRYSDRYRSHGDRWLLLERTVRLQTRQLGIGSHQFP